MFVLSRTSTSMLLSVAAAGLALATAPAAFAAENWYSATDPLNVSDDGTVRGSAHGTAYKKDGFLKNHTYYRDRRSNDNRVYTETSYSYYKWCGTEVAWCAEVGKDQSARTSSGTYVDQYDADDYSERGSADKGRVHVKVCEDQNWSADPCSRKPYFTFLL